MHKIDTSLLDDIDFSVSTTDGPTQFFVLNDNKYAVSSKTMLFDTVDDINKHFLKLNADLLFIYVLGKKGDKIRFRGNCLVNNQLFYCDLVPQHEVDESPGLYRHTPL